MIQKKLIQEIRYVMHAEKFLALETVRENFGSKAVKIFSTEWGIAINSIGEIHRAHNYLEMYFSGYGRIN